MKSTWFYTCIVLFLCSGVVACDDDSDSESGGEATATMQPENNFVEATLTGPGLDGDVEISADADAFTSQAIYEASANWGVRVGPDDNMVMMLFSMGTAPIEPRLYHFSAPEEAKLSVDVHEHDISLLSKAGTLMVTDFKGEGQKSIMAGEFEATLYNEEGEGPDAYELEGTFQVGEIE